MVLLSYIYKCVSDEMQPESIYYFLPFIYGFYVEDSLV